MYKILIIIIITLFFGCNKIHKSQELKVNLEVEKLASNSDKIKYLEMVYDTDQNIRKNNDAELDLGSKAEKEHYKKMDSIDKLNYKRVDLYLKKFGYPKKDSMSVKAASAPWLVIHHSNLNDRRKHFKTLHKAYQEGNIDVMQFDFYLGRTYQMKFGEYPKWEGPYKPEDKVEWLIQELDL
jgi:hypothetical protein